MTNSHDGQKIKNKIQVDKYWNFPLRKYIHKNIYFWESISHLKNIQTNEMS